METPTLGWHEASEEAKSLVSALRDVLRNEEAWAIAEEHLRMARAKWEAEYADRSGAIRNSKADSYRPLRRL